MWSHLTSIQQDIDTANSIDFSNLPIPLLNCRKFIVVDSKDHSYIDVEFAPCESDGVMNQTNFVAMIVTFLKRFLYDIR